MSKTCNDYLNLWLQGSSMRSAGKDNLKHIRRALKEVLEILGFSTLAMKPTEFYEFLDQLMLKTFFEALRTHLLSGEAAKLQATSGLSADFWIEGICKLHKQAVSSKNCETSKNRASALERFTKFLVRQSEWALFCPLDVPEVRPRSLGKALPPVYPDRKYERYGLPQQEWPQHLRDAIAALREFWLTGGEAAWEELLEERQATKQPAGSRPRMKPAKPQTIDHSIKVASRYFGWQVQILGVAKKDLSLTSLTHPLLIRKFRNWQRQRKRSHSIVLALLKVGIAVAKQENFALTQRRQWEDVPAVLDLQDLQAEFSERYKTENAQAKDQKRPVRAVSHPELEQMQKHLLHRCAPFYEGANSKKEGQRGTERAQSAIVWDRLIYTVASFLTFTPVRQQQVRTADSSESLLNRKDAEGVLSYILYSREHKLEGHTGKPHVCRLPRNLTPILDAWINTYRPLAEKAVENLDNWLAFWGHKPDALQRLQARLEAAQQGQIPKCIKSVSAYIQKLEQKIKQLVRRIEALSTARENLKKHNYLFFSLGGSRPESFGKPLSDNSVTALIIGAMAESSRAVFEDKVIRISPHVFRYIAALHVRRINGNVEDVCKILNHSRSTDDEYAQVTRDLIEDAVDVGEWWIAS